MFINLDGEIYRVLLGGDTGAWVISCDVYTMPEYMDRQHLERAERIQTPEEFVMNRRRKMTDAQAKRYDLIKPLLTDPLCITDEKRRNEVLDTIANEAKTTKRRLCRLFYSYLARGCLVQSKPRQTIEREDFDRAIRKYYFSAKRNSLRTAYELFILEYYSENGVVSEDAPSWDSFRHYYQRNWRLKRARRIARDGLTNYQRNERPLYGSAMQYRNAIGCYQIDETPADIYLVSKWDRTKVIGRPNIYLAIDTASGLIAGIYIGLEAGERAFASCLANAAADKVAFCRKFGIEIDFADWPSKGLPAEIITDRGNEFTGSRMDEMCLCYGIDCQTLPPFRAEQKPLVERAMGLIQESYKSVLRGRGIIGDDVAERWSEDYRRQAILTLEEYSAIVIHCVLALNKGRVLTDIGHLPMEAPNTPSKLWLWLVEQGKSNLLQVDEREVYIRSLPRESVKVTRKGVVFRGMRYLPERGNELEVGQTMELAYDVSETGTVFAFQEDKRILPCYLAPSNARYQGYGHEDVSLMRKQESGQVKSARQEELAVRVRMHDEIQKITKKAEKESESKKDTADIPSNRNWERSRLS